MGITRAKKELQLCSAVTRMIFGQTRRNSPSRFLQEIGGDCLEEQASELRTQMRQIQNVWGDRETSGDAAIYTGGGLHMAANDNETRSFGGGSAGGSSAGRSGAQQGEFSIRSAYERESRRSGAFAPTDSFASRSSLINKGAAERPAAGAGAAAAGGKLAVGDKVRHKVFGEGIVQAVTPVAGDFLVEVQFASTVKKMMANYAPLTKLE